MNELLIGLWDEIEHYRQKYADHSTGDHGLRVAQAMIAERLGTPDRGDTVHAHLARCEDCRTHSGREPASVKLT